jgi:hypothetical protein
LVATQRLLGLLLPAAIVASEGMAQSQGTVLHATVADATTGIFLLDAEVTVSPLGLKGLTDFLGDARFSEIPRGVYTVKARRIGYEPLGTKAKLSGRDSLEVVLLLQPISQELATVTIEGTASSPFLKEFDERRRQGKGYYITEAELRASFGSAIENIVASKIPGITIRGGPGPTRTVYSTRGTHSTRKGACAVAVYWNGIRVGTDPTIVPLEFIGGIEFYTTGYIPVQYRELGNDCGVMLLWPRG